MDVSTSGLVLREVKTGEADRILTILTPTHGVISAAAKGSLRPKSKLFSATGLFCYSDWQLREGASMYRVQEATPIEVFFGLRQSIEAVALATYIAEISRTLSPMGGEAQRVLQLVLNSYYYLSQGEADPCLVKAAFEIRALYEAGFMPEIIACGNCGSHASASYCFSFSKGTLLCGECAAKMKERTNLDMSALAAVQYILQADLKRVFGFEIKGDSLKLLRQMAQDGMLYHLDYPPKSLAFLKTVLPV